MHSSFPNETIHYSIFAIPGLKVSGFRCLILLSGGNFEQIH